MTSATTDTRIIASLVVRDEAERYLGAVLNHLWSFVDDIFVYDDASEDDSAAVAKEHGAVVEIRPAHYPSFLEHEGQFRHDALLAMQSHMQPVRGDWIFVPDADEFLVSSSVASSVSKWNLRSDLIASMYSGAINFHVREVFDVDALGVPLVRTDGYWGDIYQLKMYAWESMGVFPDKRLACGSVPLYVNNRTAVVMEDLNLLHYGYARAEDRVQKYARYFGAPGHNVTHIDSILRPPSLQHWDGYIPRLS